MIPSAPTTPWTPSGIVTLLTDFGTDETYVGIMKGVLWERHPGLRAVVDLVHAIPPQDVRAAAFHLMHSWAWFPAGTVHVAVVDPGVGSERPILVAEHGGHAFLAPDNGLLAPLLGPESRVRRLDLERFSLARRSRTFHGRDVFAPAAARLAAGAAPAEAGDPAEDWVKLSFPAVREERGALLGEVLLADRFGNLVTNVGRDRLYAAEPEGAAEPGAPTEAAWSVEIGGRGVPLRRAYSEAEPGELLALVDSYGLLEIAVREGSAARKLGAGAGMRVRVARSAR